MLANLREAARAFGQGQFQQAADLCAAVLSEQPELAEASYLMGLALAELGRYTDALQALEGALARTPGQREWQHNLARVQSRCGQWERVIETLPDPDPAGEPDIALIKAKACFEHGQAAEAEGILNDLLSAHPSHGAAQSQLCLILERTRRDDEALSQARAALATGHSFTPALVEARVLGRRGEVDGALSRLHSLIGQEPMPANRALAAGEMGRLLDRSGRYDEALVAFDAANRTLAQTPQAVAVRGTSVYSSAAIAEMSAYFNVDRLHRWRNNERPSSGDQSPVFLVGFPRSGTTLMDRVLDAHPSVEVIEERPTLHDALSRFAQSTSAWEALDGAEEHELDPFRSAYLQRVRDELPGLGEDQVVVDKLPLNILFVGLIHRLFPSARFIVAIRDPRDVCLSCYMQSFALNDAMSKFLALDTTVGYYCEVMELGLRLLDHLPVHQHRLRYEDLVEDLEGQTRGMLEFLQLPWQDSVLRYFDHARGKSIDTPSYDQVTRPIYGTAMGRWTHYRKALEPYLDDLQPFVRKFGYAPGADHE